MKLKSEDKVKAIQKAVTSIVKKEGIAGIKMSKVASQANIAQGTVYIYYKNKSELINKIYKELKKESTHFLSFEKYTDMSYVSAFKAIWINYCTYLINNDEAVHFMKQCMESEFLDKESKTLSSNFMIDVFNFFQKGIDEHFLNDYDINLIISIFSGFARELTSNIITTQFTKNTKEIFNSSFEMCWNAVRR